MSIKSYYIKLIKFLSRPFIVASSYLPTPLPLGMAEFDVWAGEVISLTKLPDNASTRFALASCIPHQSGERYRTPKAKFATLLQKAASNQIALGYMQEAKAKQIADLEAARLAETPVASVSI